MDRKTLLLLIIAVTLVALWSGRILRGDKDETVKSEISIRYLACTNCEGQYEIAADYFLNVDPSDVNRGAGTAAFRCRECGEIAAQPGMIVKMAGEVVSVVGHEYREERGLDEMR